MDLDKKPSVFFVQAKSDQQAWTSWLGSAWGTLQQPGAAGGTVETGQMFPVETRQMSQQQSSVLSQQQTSLLSQQKASGCFGVRLGGTQMISILFTPNMGKMENKQYEHLALDMVSLAAALGPSPHAPGAGIMRVHKQILVT